MKLNFKSRYFVLFLIVVLMAIGSLYLLFSRQVNEVPEKADLVLNDTCCGAN